MDFPDGSDGHDFGHDPMGHDPLHHDHPSNTNQPHNFDHPGYDTLTPETHQPHDFGHHDHHAPDHHQPLELPPSKKQILQDAFEHAMDADAGMETARDVRHLEHVEQMAQSPRPQTAPAKAPAASTETKAAKSLRQRFGDLHWGAKTAIIGGTVAVGAAIGYWAFKARSDKNEQQNAEKSV